MKTLYIIKGYIYAMKKMFAFCFLLLIVSCKKTTETNTKEIVSTASPSEKKAEQNTVKPDQSTPKLQQENVNFISYPIDDLEGITGTGQNGIYRNFDFEYRNGETMFVLVPKTGAEKWYHQKVNQYKNQDADDMIEKYLNGQTFKKLSKEFKILIFHTPKKFLKHTPEMDAPYTPLPHREIFLYEYNDANNSWTTIDTFAINSDEDEAKAHEWRQKHMEKLSLGH